MGVFVEAWTRSYYCQMLLRNEVQRKNGPIKDYQDCLRLISENASNELLTPSIQLVSDHFYKGHLSSAHAEVLCQLAVNSDVIMAILEKDSIMLGEHSIPKLICCLRSPMLYKTFCCGWAIPEKIEVDHLPDKSVNLFVQWLENPLSTPHSDELTVALDYFFCWPNE